MAKWVFLSTPCLTCLIFLASASLARQLRPSAAASPRRALEPFVCHPRTGHGDATDALSLLNQTCVLLRDAQWLKATIWQRTFAKDSRFESEATLILGPNHCARMDMSLHTPSQSCRLLAVSDGRTFAEALSSPGEPDKLTVHQLPAKDAAALRQLFLRKHGCVGLLPLMLEMKASVTAWQAARGSWRNLEVVRLVGKLKAGPADNNPPPAERANQVRVYFDAESKLPLRVEWLAVAESGHAELLLEMEYRGLQINRPLSPEECARTFTFAKHRVASSPAQDAP